MLTLFLQSILQLHVQCYLEIIKWTKILGQENKQDWIQDEKSQR
jgi:hypothetical protein